MNLEQIKNILRKSGYCDFKEFSSRRMAIMTDGDRLEIAQQVEKRLKRYGARYVKRPQAKSSIGAIILNDMHIYVKPKDFVRYGIENESLLVNKINRHSRKPIKVVFLDLFKHNLKIRDVVRAKHAGADVRNNKKADVVILTTKTGKTIPISLKKDNAEHWGSVAGYWITDAKRWVKKLCLQRRVKLVKVKYGYDLRPRFAVKANLRESKYVIFGSDIRGMGAVIQRTFSNDDFKLRNGVLYITCSRIVKHVRDLPKDEKPWFYIRPDKARSIKGFYPGLRIVAVYSKGLSKSVLRIRP